MALQLNSILNAQTCGSKAFFEKFALNSSKGKHYYLAIALKNFLRDFNVRTGHIIEMESLLNSYINDDIFLTKEEKQAEIEILIEQLTRYLVYERSFKRKILARNISEVIKVQGHEISVMADVAFENDDFIEIVKFKKGKPSLSYRAQKAENKPENSVELYMMQKLGEKLFSHKPVKASYYFLKSKNDEKGNLSPEFDEKIGDNIISYKFADIISSTASLIESNHSNELESKIVSLINMELSFLSEKTCDATDCENCNFSKICNYENEIPQELEIVEEPKKTIKKEIKLTVDQKKAVEFKYGYARINAGAGTGKSYTICQRVVELIKNGCKPEDILLITFTNKACQELKEKIKYWVKAFDLKIDINKIQIHTFNSYGDYVVREEYLKLGFDEKPKLAEKVEKYDIIMDLLSKLPNIKGLDYRNPLMNMIYAKGSIVQVSKLVDKMKSKNYKTVEDFALDINEPIEYAKKIWELNHYFNEALLDARLLQYQDQINYTLQLFSASAQTMSKYAVKHIMIDEMQDTDVVQMEIIKLFTQQSKFQSLMVVGDDSQAIFSFRDVSPDNILKFKDVFPMTKDIYMVDNFRSTPEIISTANCLNSINKKRVDKNLISRNPHGSEPLLTKYKDSPEEYSEIVQSVKSKINDGYAPNGIAIIARTNKELLEIQSFMKVSGIPVRVDVPEKLLNNKNVHMLISFAEFANDVNLEIHLLEYLMVIKHKEIREMNIEEIKKLVEETKSEFLNEFLSLQNEQEKIDLFFRWIDAIGDVDKDVADFVKTVREKSFKSLNEVTNYLIKFALYEDEKTINKDETKYKAVILTTAHSAKGKEFDVVYVTLNKFKYSGKNIGEAELEEERRLLFVSITRAKKELFITCSKLFNGKKNNGYINFIQELKVVYKEAV